MLAAVAVVAVLAAIVLNALLAEVPGRANAQGPGAGGGSLDTTTAPPFAVPKAPLEMLPKSIISYETITRQGVPGRMQTAAEALYVTLNMETEIQVPIGSYVHVEVYASEAEARAAVDTLMKDFSLRPEQLVLGGVTPAVAGYAPNEGAWTVAWTRGPWAVYAKTLFRDKVPVQKRDFLHRLGFAVAEGVDKFQRTGQQGLEF